MTKVTIVLGSSDKPDDFQVLINDIDLSKEEASLALSDLTMIGEDGIFNTDEYLADVVCTYKTHTTLFSFRPISFRSTPDFKVQEELMKRLNIIDTWVKYMRYRSEITVEIDRSQQNI